MKTKIFYFLLFFCISRFSNAKELNLLPKPQLICLQNGKFTIGKISLSTPVLNNEYQSFIIKNGGSLSNKSSSQISIKIVPSIVGVRNNPDEAYRLSVSSSQIKIEATTEKGAYWALQTLRQLGQRKEGKTSFPACTITDWPAFHIRGFMQDVGRSYISIKELKKQIEMLSRFKINVFHWHLTENQSWRLESKQFPMLNDSINTTRMPGKYYTLKEASELVDFCKKHNVMLIPEFDMPGHSAAFVRTFRHDMQSKEGMKILKLLLDEVCETFDVPYIHIGTDEVSFTNPSFVPEMVAYVRSKGKKVISWNPGWKYKPGEVDMTHLWSSRGKAQPGIPAIDSRFHYLNHYDSFADIVALYNSRIYDKEEGNSDIAGVILALWNDRLVTPEENIALENGLYPHTLAIAERSWQGGGSEYFNNKGTILAEENTLDFQNFADFERRMLWHKEHTFKGYPFGYVKQTHVKWNVTDAFPNNGDLTKSFPPEKELKESYTYNGNTYRAQPAIGAGIYLRHVWGTLVPGFYKSPKENHTAYAYTWVYSPKDQEVGLWAEFQNYGRSEMDLPPLPGTWDYKSSRIWINDKEIVPPTWTATHQNKSNEIALGNENCVARPPIEVSLCKGWNKVLLKLPIGQFTSKEIRLVKWMFTAVFVTLDGKNAVENLIYSPQKKLLK